MNKQSPHAWLDPAIIIRTKSKLDAPDYFLDKYCVSITRKNEEFYSILSDEQQIITLERYFKKLCIRNKMADIKRSELVINLSKINHDFNKYLIEKFKEYQ